MLAKLYPCKKLEVIHNHKNVNFSNILLLVVTMNSI